MYQKLERYDDSRASLSTWIYTITRNTVIDYYKKRKTQAVSFDEIVAFEYPYEMSADEELFGNLIV